MSGQVQIILYCAGSCQHVCCVQLTDGMILDGLWDPYKDVHMGACADRCAQQYSISRAEQDAHAIESHQRARRAHDAGFSGRVSLMCPPCRAWLAAAAYLHHHDAL